MPPSRLVRSRPHLRRQRGEPRFALAQQRFVRRLQIDPDRRDTERVRDQPRVSFVVRIAAARHDHAGNLSRGGELTQPRHDRRVDPAAQPDDEPARRCRGAPAAGAS